MRLVLAMFLSAGVATTAPAGDHPTPLPVVPAPPDFESGHYVGRIVSTIKGGLVIKPERSVGTIRNITLPDGKPARQLYIQDNTRPAREFAFDDCLFPDRPGPKTPRVGQHEVSELQVGDVVTVTYRCVAGNALCTDVAIIRRPGGKVPPAIHDSALRAASRHDTRCNAEQFVEEKVVPVTLPRLLRNIRP